MKRFFLSVALVAVISAPAYAGHVIASGGSALSGVSVNARGGASINNLGINSGAWGGSASAFGSTGGRHSSVGAFGGDAASMVSVKARGGSVVNTGSVNSNAWGGSGSGFAGGFIF